MNKAKIGIIGAGWWATEFHIPHLKEREDVELTSVCKLEEDELKFVKEKFEEGFNEKEIKKILTKRYGEYILFKPYFNLKNLFLWLFPFILVILSIIILIKYSKKTKTK